MRKREADFRFPEVSGPASEAAGCWCIFPSADSSVQSRDSGKHMAWRVGHRLGCYADEEVVLAAVGTRRSERLRGRSVLEGTRVESVKRSGTRSRLKDVLSGCLALKSCPSCPIRFVIRVCVASKKNIDKELSLMPLTCIRTFSSRTWPIIWKQQPLLMQISQNIPHFVFSRVPFLELFDSSARLLINDLNKCLLIRRIWPQIKIKVDLSNRARL